MVNEAEPAYFAVPDPDDPTHMTYWRRDAHGRIRDWPPQARYGPRLHQRDVPADLTAHERSQWIEAWHSDHFGPWHATVRSTIEANPTSCAVRFAELQTRCCFCGRRLTNAASKAYSIGPECRRSLPGALLAEYAMSVGQAHAALLYDVPDGAGHRP